MIITGRPASGLAGVRAGGRVCHPASGLRFVAIGIPPAVLLEVRYACVPDRRYARVTVADVVRHARTSRQTFYEHIPSKQASFIDLLRIQKRAPQFLPFEVVGQISQPQDDRTDEDTILEAALEEAVKLLPDDEKQLLEWVYFNDLSQKQIAESTQTTPKAVESKLARVRQKLRNMLTTILSHEKQF